MKKTIPFVLLILSAIQFTIAQKINLTYKIKSNDSLFVIEDNAFSEKDIQTKSDKLFLIDIPNKNIISIEDNIGRRFDKINFNKNTYYSKLLNEGYFNLYVLDVNKKPVYIICSKTDTLILEKNDSLVNQSIISDRKYNGRLVLLCKDYPDLWEKAGKISFKNKELQNLISALNDKYPDSNTRKQGKNRMDYWGLSLKGMVMKDYTDITFDVLKSRYFLDISPDFSFRYGLRVNYINQTQFFPALFSGWYYTGPDGIEQKVYVYKDHYETLTAKVLEMPFWLNYEITNSTITPYLYGGLSPTVIFRKITRTDSDEIDNIGVVTLNAFTAGGVKLKLTNGFNVLSELKFDLNKGFNLALGIEYYFKL